MSHKGVIRGLHYQLPPKAQGKLIRVVYGKVFDVVVDIRKNSPTFGYWVGEILTNTNKKQLWIPEGFAHGFQALENQTEVLYFSSAQYNPTKERGILWNSFGCKWPITDKNKIFLSNRDKRHIDFINK